MPFQWGGEEQWGKISCLVFPALIFIDLYRSVKMVDVWKTPGHHDLTLNSRIRVHGIVEIECLTDRKAGK